MRKIEFGYSNDLKSNGSWEYLGINSKLFLASADYYGVVAIGADSFVVAKVVEDQYGRYPQLLNNFIVMDAVYDLYPDGSGILLLDQEKSEYAKQLEEHFNNPIRKNNIRDINDIYDFDGGISRPTEAFRIMEQEMPSCPIIATSIRHSAFERKKAKNLKNSIPNARVRL